SDPRYFEGESVVLQGGKLLVDPNAELYRFNSDGSRDWTFNAKPEFNDQVNSLAIQEDGKMIVVGSFSAYNDVLINRIARLHPDGTLDESFKTGKGFEFVQVEGEYSTHSGIPEGVVLQDDGKLLVYG